MNCKKVGLLALIASLTLAFFIASVAVASAETIYVDGGNQTIGQAVDNATAGDTIIVRDGVYNENVDVNKALTIRSENGAASTTVMALDPGDHIFEVTADYVDISGFTVTGATTGMEDPTGVPVAPIDYLAGVYLGIDVDHCNISNNNATKNICGIHLEYSSNNNNTITENILSGNGYGIFLQSSNNNILTENILSGNGYGIFLQSSNNNILTGNVVPNNPLFGINLKSSNNNILTQNIVTGNGNEGIYLSDSNSNIITRNTVTNNGYGIHLESLSNYNTIAENVASSNINDGINLLDSCDYNTIAENTASNNVRGIYIVFSSNSNTLTENILISNSDYGIIIENSNNNTLRGNTMSDNGYNFGIYGNSLSHYTHDIDATNRVDEKPVYYIVNDQNMQIPTDAGYVGVINSTGISIKDLILTLNSHGVLIAYTSDSVVENVDVSGNRNGIYLYSSTNNTLTKNTANANDVYGINLEDSSNNFIYDNYLTNTNNAFDNGNSNNFWNITKTEGTNILGGSYLGGNYWSDYLGNDVDGDGLGDTITPFDSSGNIANGGDWHPLVNRPPNTPDNPSPENQSTGYPIDAGLSWTGGDPDSLDTVTYDAYFGTDIDPPLGSGDLTSPTYNPGTLGYNTTYHWKIVATDNHGVITTGPLWIFTTELKPPKKDNPGGSGDGGAKSGGGGGGGGGWAPPKGNLPTDREGIVKSTTTIFSSDETAKLIIPEGVTALDVDGKALKSIKIGSTPIGGTIAAYNLGPDGSTFNPSINFTATYDPKDVSEGNVVVIKTFDGSKWVPLKTTVNTTTSTATAELSHFTIFALFTEKMKTTAKKPSMTMMSFPEQMPANAPVTEEQSPEILPPGEEQKPVVPWAIILVAVIVIEIIMGLILYVQGKQK